MTTATPTERIIIVSGQEFRVPLATPLADVRAHLAQTFPDVASATEQKGKKKIDGVEYETVEFIKKAGTKGLEFAAVVAALADLAPLPVPQILSHAELERIIELRAGNMTFAEALELDVIALVSALSQPQSMNGVTLCNQLDNITPVAHAARSFGW